MTDKQPYSVPDEPGRWRAITLAIIVHTALIALLWVGVRWQNETPVALEAELWSPDVREAAPRPEPKPEPEPVAKPEPVRKADPKPVPAIKLPPPPKPVETPVEKPDIALEQEKKRQIRVRKERLEDEREDRLKAEKLRADQDRKDQVKVDEKRQAKRDADEAAREKAEAADAARKKADAVAEAAKSKAADAVKKKVDAADLAKKKADAADAAKKTAADKQRRQDLADELDGEKRRADEMRRVTGGVTGSGGAGTAPKSQGGRADSGYVNRVGAKIKSNTIFNTPESLDNNPSVEYEVSLLPDGSIRGIRKLKSSNVSGFDDAVQRAINKSAPFPPDQTGIAPTSFTLIHRPKDQ